MRLVEKIGYITIIYCGCRLFFKIIYRPYKTFFSSNTSLDVYSLGKWGVITCCSSGVGRAYAEVLAKIGINIVLISPEITEKLRHLARNLEAIYHIKTKIIKLNVAEGLGAYDSIEKEIYSLDVGILINALSVCYPHPEYFLSLPYKDKIYMNIIQNNIVVVTNMCRIVLPQMVVRGKGLVINVASTDAIIPSPLLTVFAASKAYVVKFTRDLDVEYSRYGIVFQCLLPGSIASQSNKCLKSGFFAPTPEKYVRSAFKTIGKQNVTTGYLVHEFIVGIIKLLYDVSSTLVVKGLTRVMENNRSIALRRYVS